MKKKIKKTMPKAFIGFVSIITVFVLCGLAGIVSNYALAAEDNQAPQITAFDISPDSVDTSAAERTITVTMTLTDNQAGVCVQGDSDCSGRSTYLWLKAPGGEQYEIIWDFDRISGNKMNGVYRGTATLPRYSAPGNWSVFELNLYDRVSNKRTLNKSDLESSFGSGVASVNNTAAIYDNTDPNITAFDISPSTINTDHGDQTVTITFTLTDNRVGICLEGDDDCNGTLLHFFPPSGGVISHGVRDITRTSGTATNGTYSAEFTFPEGSVGGDWYVVWMRIYDKLNNYVELDKDELESRFGSGAATVRNNAISGDNAAPNVTAFEITPAEINTGDVAQTLTVNLTLTDNRAGVCATESLPCVQTPQLIIKSLIGTQRKIIDDFTRTSGNNLNGNYTATFTLPQGSKEGIWEVEELNIADRLNNLKILNSEQLNRAVPSAEGLTIANTATADSVTIEREWTITSDNTSVTFPVGTEVTRDGGGSFAFYRMTNQEFSVEEIIDEVTGLPILGMRIGIPGLNLSFDQDVTVSMNVGSEYNGQTLQIQARAEDGDTWASETECTVSEGRCSFTVDHATYFVASRVLSPKILTTSGPGEPTRLQAYSKGNMDGANSLLTNDITGLFPDSYLGGAGIVPLDYNNNGVLDQFIVYAINNGGPQARVMGLKEDGSLSYLGQMFVFDSTIRDGLSATTGDFDGDGYKDDAAFCLTGDVAPEVRVYKDVSGIDNWEMIGQFTAPFGNVGCNLGTYQYDDGPEDILVTPNHGTSEPKVWIYTVGGTLKKDFWAYDAPINQGLTATGIEDRIFTTPNNGSSQVNAFNSAGERKNFWWVYEQHVRGDFTIRAGQLDPSDEKEELLISPIGSNGPHILGYRASGVQKASPNFFAFGDSSLRNGVGIAVIEDWHGVN